MHSSKSSRSRTEFVRSEKEKPVQLDVTVRVGCSLAYDVRGPTTLILNLQPEASGRNEIVFEALALGDGLADEQFTDSHGNKLHRLALNNGQNYFRHDAIVRVSSQPDNYGLSTTPPASTTTMPVGALRYTLPSRYCDSDRLVDFAWQQFGSYEHGWPRVQAISDWIHKNIEYRYFSGRPDLSASDILDRGYGVCRDFAHLVITLCRVFNIPSRYVTGHLPDIGCVDELNPMDFHAYAEVFLGGAWHTVDARFNVPRIGRITLSCGQDAVDGAFSTIYGDANLSFFEVWAYQVPRDTVGVGDPVDLSKRLDNQLEVIRDF